MAVCGAVLLCASSQLSAGPHPRLSAEEADTLHVPGTWRRVLQTERERRAQECPDPVVLVGTWFQRHVKVHDQPSPAAGILSCGRGDVSNSDLTAILFLLLLLVGLAQLLGYLLVKLRQPKVVGEILAGVILGPALLGRFPSASRFMQAAQGQTDILNFVYWLGLLLLMFLSGAETRQLFTREERREVGWLAIVGTGIPFVLGLGLGHWLIRPSLAGPNGNSTSLVII